MMVVAYELKLSLSEVGALSPDELGQWLAFFKLKGKREQAANKSKRQQQ